MRLTDLPDTIDLAFDRAALPDGEGHAPLAMVGLSSLAVAEVARLDPDRIDAGPDVAPPARRMWRGPIGSLLLHVLPLLALVTWFRPPLEIPPLIPVKLVIEQPPPPPPAPAPQAAKPAPAFKPPPPGRRSSADMAETASDKIEKGTDTAPPTAGEPQPPATEAQPADAAHAAPADPPPTPTPADVGQPPPAAETKVALAAPLPHPKPAPPKPQTVTPSPKLDGWVLPLSPNAKQPHEARSSASFVGPNATKDEYCSYALSLITKHADLVPLSLLGARRGDTVVSLRVFENGTISQVRVVKGSGYTDIDERVAQMVVAVGRLPPLPQWMPGPYQDFIFHMHFPNFLER